MENILICGYGNIGKFVYKEISEIKSHNIFIYDTNPSVAESETHSENFITDIDKPFNFAFICVPTDMKEDGSCDTTIVEKVISKINADLIIVKSTVPIGFNKEMVAKYHKNIVYSPEYYGTTIHALSQPDFLILAGSRKDCDLVADLFHEIKPSDYTIRYTDYATAEIAKYMENSFLGLKVSFCSEFYDICEHYGVSYNELREIFVMDKRMGKSHTYINPNQPYYDSHCLNKDIPAIISQCKKAGFDLPILEAMYDENISKKNRRN